MADMAEKATLCSKCGDNEVKGESYPRWCSNCRTNYRRELEAVKEGRTEKKGFAAGVTAMRECLAAEFDKLGSGRFEASEVADLIMRSPGPKLD